MIYLRCENFRHLIYVTSKFFSVLLYKVKSPWPMKSLQPTLEKDLKNNNKTNKKNRKRRRDISSKRKERSIRVRRTLMLKMSAVSIMARIWQLLMVDGTLCVDYDYNDFR